jgi:hypothetical protein
VKSGRAHGLRITRIEAPGLDAGALARTLERELGTMPEAFPPGAVARVRLLVDTAGRVVRVAVESANDDRLRARLQAVLSRLSLGTRPAAGGTAEVVLEVKVAASAAASEHQIHGPAPR